MLQPNEVTKIVNIGDKRTFLILRFFHTPNKALNTLPLFDEYISSNNFFVMY